MIDALIIDDEPKLIEVLKIKLEDHCKEIKVLDFANNIEEAYKKIKLLNPKLIFLDISMPGGTGFQLLEKFDDINFEIVFVTGYNQYALDALKVSAIDYLLKPIRTSDLVQAVEKVVERINEKNKIKKYEIFKHNLNNIGDQNSKISIPGVDTYDFIKVSEIIRCEGWQKYTKIYLIDGKSLTSSYNIGVYKDMLSAYKFYSCHKSHLINTEHISKYQKDGIIVMADGSMVPVARRKKDEFLRDILKV